MNTKHRRIIATRTLYTSICEIIMEWLVSTGVGYYQNPGVPLFGKCPGVITENYGKPIVFIGGAGLEASKFRPVIEGIATRTKTHIFLVCVPVPFSTNDFLEGAIIAQQQAGEDATVVGYSMGASIAADICGPRTPRLILWAPLFAPLSPLASSVFSWMGESFTQFVTHYSTLFTGSLLNTPLHLQRVQCPIIFLRGDEDPIAPEYLIRGMASACRNAPVLHVTHMSHAISNQSAENFLQAFSLALSDEFASPERGPK